MQLTSSFENYKEEIELIQSQNRVECDLYSIIAHIVRNSKEGINISIRDVSVRRKTDFSIKYRGGSGFPDFVIREREKSNNAKILGAIEIKYLTEDMKLGSHSKQLSNHIDFYKRVIYTNGLEWKFYNKNQPDNNWSIFLGKIVKDKIAWEKQEQWNELLEKLDKIEWKN